MRQVRNKTFVVFATVSGALVIGAFYSVGYQFEFRQISWQIGDSNVICNCSSRLVSASKSLVEKHWCSVEATSRGDRQKVVSYSLFGIPSNPETSDRYLKLLGPLAEYIQTSYPGWFMRVHHNFTEDDSDSMRHLCQVYCLHPHVDLCNVSEVQRDPEMDAFTKNSGWNKLNPRMWRFLAAVDPAVDYFVSRDADATIIEREIDAVQQWLDSNFTFHVMRDHPFHTELVLAGMWGAKLFRGRSVIRETIFKMVHNGLDGQYATDQILLAKYLWSVAKYDVMAHDSYYCSADFVMKQSVLPTFAFPTQRNERHDFVGNVISNDGFRNQISQCPENCRPAGHQNWTYC